MTNVESFKDRLSSISLEIQVDWMIDDWSTDYAKDRAIDFIHKLDKTVTDLSKCFCITDTKRGVKFVWSDTNIGEIRYEIANKARCMDHIFIKKDGVFIHNPTFEFVVECLQRTT